ncbi:MAG TPA: hypothetical protein VF131_28660 [Blastocatellia bacterium]|nr:hypothetical protein [Blastocatellia bacterium]
MTTESVEENPDVFLSYYSGNNKSIEIKNKLAEFLKDWKIKYFDFTEAQTLGSPEDHTLDNLKRARFFLQIFTDHNNSREWMREEWVAAKFFLRTSGFPMERIVILHTNQTDLKHRTFNQLRGWLEWLRIPKYNLDDEKQVQNCLYAILIETGRIIHEKHGEVRMPTFTQPPVVAERITLEVVEEFISNFKDVSKKGLERFYADREELTPRLEKKLKELKDSRGLIRMLGFTLNDYVFPKKEGLGTLFRSAIKNHAKARLLLLDRNCKAARDRAKIESPGIKYEQSKFYTDSEPVCALYSQEPDVEIRHYDTPYLGLIICEDEAFVEIYHLGKKKGDEGKKEDQEICGHVPIWVVRNDGKHGLYQLFESHFEEVWSRSRKCKWKKPTVSPVTLTQSVPKRRRNDPNKTLRPPR